MCEESYKYFDELLSKTQYFKIFDRMTIDRENCHIDIWSEEYSSWNIRVYFSDIKQIDDRGIVEYSKYKGIIVEAHSNDSLEDASKQALEELKRIMGEDY